MAGLNWSKELMLATGERVRLRGVDPIDHRALQALVCHACGQATNKLVSEPVYPPPPPVREVRQREPWLTLRQAAKQLGLKPSELSAVELGAATCEPLDALWRALGRWPLP